MKNRIQGESSPLGLLLHIKEKILPSPKQAAMSIFFATTLFSGHVIAQITLKEQQAPMSKVFKSIEKQSGYVFVYNENKIKLGKISIQLRDASLKKALEVCLRNTDITYEIVAKTIVLRRKEEPVVEFTKETSSKATLVLGTVYNTKRQPLNGATVLLKRTRTGTTTDIKGKYLLKNAEPSDTLLISYLGYVTKEIALSASITNDPVIDIVLVETTNDLDEAVVQGYGKTSKRLATGNITRVSGKELTEQPVLNPLLALQGKVPGVVISQVNGNASGPVKVEIRGRKALNNSFPSDPLYIINGLPITVLEVRGPATRAGDGATFARGYDQSGVTSGISPLFSINPEDIESIEVLKDADATAIYGSRGANGVVLITTKKGIVGATKLALSFNRGVNFATRYFEMLGTEDYLNMRREAFKNAGVIPDGNNAYDLFSFDQHHYTDWQRYRQGSSSQNNLQASVSGGNELTTYRIGGSYATTHDLRTITGKNERGTFTFNLHNQSRDQKIVFDVDASYTVAGIDANDLNSIYTLPPNAPDPYDEQGNLNWAAWGTGHVNYPFGRLKSATTQNGKTLNSGLKITYNILKGLSASTKFGYNNVINETYTDTPIASQDPLSPYQLLGSSVFATTKVNNIITEPQFDYNTLIGRGRLTILLGASYQQNNTSMIRVNAKNYTDDALLGSITNAPLVEGEDDRGKYKYAGIFSRVNFIWDNKYILNLNGRRDGSSRFGQNSRFGNFYSIGVAWNLSDESWAKKILPRAINFFKLRGSYGITGSDAIGDYKYLTQYGNKIPVLPDYNGISPITPQIQPNLDYHWQVNRQSELALQLGMFEDRLIFDVSAYRSFCDNQLIDFPTPSFTGFTSVIANSPAKIENDGIEFQLNGIITKTKEFSWSSSFNLGFNRNRLVAYPNLEKSPYASTLEIGKAVGNVYVLKFLGVDPLNGEYLYEDYNGDGKIDIYKVGDPKADRYISIKTVPDFTGNLGQSFTYRGFSLSANLYFVKQLGRNYLFSNASGRPENISKERYDTRWQNPGDQALTSRISLKPSTSINQITESDRSYTDASYIRLNSVNLSGTVPSKWVKWAGVTNLNINVSASNLFVITKYKGLDPSVQNFGGSLPTRTVSLGVNCSF